MRSLVLLILLAAAGATAARADTVQIPALKDNTIFEPIADTLSSNGAGPYCFAGDNGQGNTRRALLAFDVAGNVPSGATIDSVELKLHMSQTPEQTPRAITVHVVLADWGEGSSFSDRGAGATPETDDATWLHRFFPTVLWSTAGGDFSSTVSATTQVAGVGFYSWRNPTLTADVQTWLDQPSTNFGWLLRGVETQLSTVRRFDTRENTTAANRPVLIVHFTRDVLARQVTWGRVKSEVGD